ncbi:uncharacterized protein LOC111045174 [Nilaparvata lugens]|uniref:uncharacterized protein LOC111045174 n=1 Tax=Nilaparvata lugens TaxID=108931 RepID=UPI000B9866AC|nr:uncharacterized protein LOC111045174 [Nilaparvata lugens]
MKSIILLLVIGVGATCGQIYRSSYAPAGSMYPRPQSAYEEEEAILDRSKGSEDSSSNVPVEDVNLRNQVQFWPKEKQPFWYLNAQAINRQIGKVNGAVVQSSTTDSTTTNTDNRASSSPQSN